MAVGRRVFVMHTLKGIEDVVMCKVGANPKSTCRVLWPWQQSKSEARRPTAKVDNRSARRRNRKPLAGFAGFLKAHDTLPGFTNVKAHARRQGMSVAQLAAVMPRGATEVSAMLYEADGSGGWRYVGR